jgi:hypothetical protein
MALTVQYDLSLLVRRKKSVRAAIYGFCVGNKQRRLAPRLQEKRYGYKQHHQHGMHGANYQGNT